MPTWQGVVTHAYICTHTHTHTHTHTYMSHTHTLTHTHTHTYSHTHTHTHTHTYTHTHTCTHTHTSYRLTHTYPFTDSHKSHSSPSLLAILSSLTKGVLPTISKMLLRMEQWTLGLLGQRKATRSVHSKELFRYDTICSTRRPSYMHRLKLSSYPVAAFYQPGACEPYTRLELKDCFMFPCLSVCVFVRNYHTR